MSNVRRVYVEKKPAFAVQAKELKHEVSSYLGIKSVTAVRVLIRYDVENISDEVFDKACKTVFAEPPVDDLYLENFEAAEGSRIFSVEFLPGQFDQRADSAVQCVQFLDENAQPIIRSATTYVIEGTITDEEFDAIKHHCINPVDSRETGLQKPETLVTVFPEPEDVKIFDGFKEMPEAELKELYDSLNLAMTFKDFQHIQHYFKEEEKRDPSMTEIRVLDTYWSDHCRHTTFSTELTDVKFDEGDYKAPIVDTYNKYLADREELYKGRKDKFVCLMDLALMAMKKLKAEGKLADQEESDEINACSIVVPVDVDGKEEEWLINFKNETHNHPTEIEPFGGAATCLGGAIRDPLSGRTYVYQAMRVTGAADPTVSVKETLKGKLPQKKLVREAAHGYSSYGNQIGLATGYVKEIYHPDYVAKRMEIGAVMGAAPRKDVKRMTSDPGDIIILLGGRTGRDGIGGATGSSKVHTEASIEVCGAEVQKGNAPTERKIQRMFRRPEVSRLIKKCNDFGAGGVSVAIGELADGLNIYLDKVPKKYAGLDGTEIAISESQERMAVVVDPKDVEEFLKYANEENLEAVEVAVVTESPRLVLIWRDKEIVNISRAFLDTNGAHQETDVKAEIPSQENKYFTKPEVTDADVEAELKKVQEQNARLLTVEDRGVEDGDQTVIDFEGFVDGKGFEGGKAEDYPLTIGSHSFIDTFEEQLIGKKIGEECEVNVTFPTEYHAADLAGKPATFKVTVKEIKVKELPELNDEFASEVSEFDTLDEYKKDVEKKLAEKKEIEANSKNEDAVVAKVVENATMEIPDKMIDAQAENMVQDMARRMQSQGLSLDMYLKYTGMTVEQMKEQARPDAEKRIRTRLVLEAVAKAENIQISDEKVDEEVAKMAEAYKMEVEKLKSYMSESDVKQMKEDLAVQQAVDLLVAEAKLA